MANLVAACTEYRASSVSFFIPTTEVRDEAPDATRKENRNASSATESFSSQARLQRSSSSSAVTYERVSTSCKARRNRETKISLYFKNQETLECPVTRLMCQPIIDGDENILHIRKCHVSLHELSLHHARV